MTRDNFLQERNERIIKSMTRRLYTTTVQNSDATLTFWTRLKIEFSRVRRPGFFFRGINPKVETSFVLITRWNFNDLPQIRGDFAKLSPKQTRARPRFMHCYGMLLLHHTLCIASAMPTLGALGGFKIGRQSL
jgi:hypothetical protein